MVISHRYRWAMDILTEYCFFYLPTFSCRALISSVSFFILASCSSLLTHQLPLNSKSFKTWSTPWLPLRGNHFQSQSLTGSGTRALSPGIGSYLKSSPFFLSNIVFRHFELGILHPGLVFYPKEQEASLDTSKCSLSCKVGLVF